MAVTSRGATLALQPPSMTPSSTSTSTTATAAGRAAAMLLPALPVGVAASARRLGSLD